ncbi:MAG: transporter substrate-binding domain-containing protein [Planctomycetota bacterium]|jgi:ABC-type amino acid transport substrate-binding protein|nr:transporter substrate-binding domain-containing protein [Planctomycetota bacterium]
MRKTAFLAALAAALLATTVFAGEARGSIAKIMRTKTLTLNINAAGEPFMFRDKNGYPTGLSMDVQKMLARDFDADLVITDVDWAGLIPAMLANKSDFLAIHLSQTIDRAKIVAFTQPFLSLSLCAFIKAGDKDRYGDWRNLNQPSAKVAIISGTFAEAAAKTLFFKAELVAFGTDVDCFQALISGRANAHINSYEMISMVKTTYPDVIVADQPSVGVKADKMAFATRPDDLFANKFLDYWISENIENGKMPAIIDYWFNNDAYIADFKVNAEKGKMSKDREQLVNLLGIADYSPYFGDDAYRVKEQ